MSVMVTRSVTKAEAEEAQQRPQHAQQPTSANTGEGAASGGAQAAGPYAQPGNPLPPPPPVSSSPRGQWGGDSQFGLAAPDTTWLAGLPSIQGASRPPTGAWLSSSVPDPRTAEKRDPDGDALKRSPSTRIAPETSDFISTANDAFERSMHAQAMQRNTPQHHAYQQRQQQPFQMSTPVGHNGTQEGQFVLPRQPQPAQATQQGARQSQNVQRQQLPQHAPQRQQFPQYAPQPQYQQPQYQQPYQQPYQAHAQVGFDRERADRGQQPRYLPAVRVLGFRGGELHVPNVPGGQFGVGDPAFVLLGPPQGQPRAPAPIRAPLQEQYHAHAPAPPNDPRFPVPDDGVSASEAAYDAQREGRGAGGGNRHVGRWGDGRGDGEGGGGGDPEGDGGDGDGMPDPYAQPHQPPPPPHWLAVLQGAHRDRQQWLPLVRDLIGGGRAQEPKSNARLPAPTIGTHTGDLLRDVSSLRLWESEVRDWFLTAYPLVGTALWEAVAGDVRAWLTFVLTATKAERAAVNLEAIPVPPELDEVRIQEFIVQATPHLSRTLPTDVRRAIMERPTRLIGYASLVGMFVEVHNSFGVTTEARLEELTRALDKKPPLQVSKIDSWFGLVMTAQAHGWISPRVVNRRVMELVNEYLGLIDVVDQHQTLQVAGALLAPLFTLQADFPTIVQIVAFLRQELIASVHPRIVALQKGKSTTEPRETREDREKRHEKERRDKERHRERREPKPYDRERREPKPLDRERREPKPYDRERREPKPHDRERREPKPHDRRDGRETREDRDKRHEREKRERRDRDPGRDHKPDRGREHAPYEKRRAALGAWPLRPGDWLCPCTAHNFQSRSDCFKCKKKVQEKWRVTASAAVAIGEEDIDDEGQGYEHDKQKDTPPHSRSDSSERGKGEDPGGGDEAGAHAAGKGKDGKGNGKGKGKGKDGKPPRGAHAAEGEVVANAPSVFAAGGSDRSGDDCSERSSHSSSNSSQSSFQ